MLEYIVVFFCGLALGMAIMWLLTDDDSDDYGERHL